MDQYKNLIHWLSNIRSQLTWIIILLLVLLIISVNVKDGSTSDFYKDGEFEATLTHTDWDLFEVNLSIIPNLNWISTIACVEILVMDDVIIETYKSRNRNKVIGGFFLYS